MSGSDSRGLRPSDSFWVAWTIPLVPRLPSPHPGASYAGRKQGSGPQLRATGRRLPRRASRARVGSWSGVVGAVYSVDPWRCGKLTSATALCAWFKLVSHVYKLDLVQELVRAVLWRRGVGGGVYRFFGTILGHRKLQPLHKRIKPSPTSPPLQVSEGPTGRSADLEPPCVRVCARASGHRTGAAARTEGTSTCAAWR